MFKIVILRLGKYFKSETNKCAKGMIRGFKRAVFLVRNPYDSIWSEYQRKVARSHVGGVYKRDFDFTNWHSNAAALSHM